MKSKILAAVTMCLVLFTMNLNAQIPIDVKVNPIGVIFGDPDISAEFLINDQIGIEPTLLITTGKTGINDISYKRRGIGGMVAGKYYFNPIRGGDRFNVGLYGKYKANKYFLLDNDSERLNTSRAAFGFLLGSKFVSQNNILFEFTFGMGRSFTLDSEGDADILSGLPGIDFVGRLAVGYRFGDTGAAVPNEKKKKKRRR